LACAGVAYQIIGTWRDAHRFHQPLSLTLITAAQNQALTFEVVAIKPVKSFPRGGQRGSNGDPGAGIYLIENHRFTGHAVTLYDVIKGSYGITASSCIFSECDFLIGGPDWVRSDQFDIQALMPDDSPAYTYRQLREGKAPVLQAMLQAMLADRFKLLVHREMKEVPVYALTVARGGHKLTPSKDDDKFALNISGVPNGQTDRLLVGKKAPMANLVTLLGLPAITDKPVLDRTGLTGDYNFEVKFAPLDNNAFGNTSSPSIFTALQEQVGLKLEVTRAPLEVFVIDHAEKPDAN
jgi:uncharacterized protein (TIGR03435 family)